MVNLEALGSLAVNGTPAACDDVLRALALELATSHWSGQFELVLVGFGAELERFERVSAEKDVQALIHNLWCRRLNAEELLRTFGFESFSEARCADGSGRWDPIVVLCGPATEEGEVADLLDVASDPRTGAATVFCGVRAGGGHVVSLTGPDLGSSLSLLSSVVFPQRVEAEELSAATVLLDTASRRQSVLSSAEPYVSLPIPLPAPEDVASPSGVDRLRMIEGSSWDAAAQAVGGPDRQEEKSPTVEVAVLGPVEIRGAPREFTRAWAKELVVYLAMHPNGATNDTWATALWPDRLMAPSSLHSTASVARRSLGQGPDGNDHLPRSHGRLALAPTVVTDWSRFVGLADTGGAEQWRVGALTGARTTIRRSAFLGLAHPRGHRPVDGGRHCRYQRSPGRLVVVGAATPGGPSGRPGRDCWSVRTTNGCTGC